MSEPSDGTYRRGATTDRRRVSVDDVEAESQEAMEARHAHERQQREARAVMEEEMREDGATVAGGYTVPSPPSAAEPEAEPEMESPVQAPEPQPQSGARKVTTAFLIVVNLDGTIGAENDVSQQLELERPANFGDFHMGTMALQSELQANKIADTMMAKVAGMQQQMQAMQQAQAAGVAPPMAGMPGMPVTPGMNRQQRRHPGR